MPEAHFKMKFVVLMLITAAVSAPAHVLHYRFYVASNAHLYLEDIESAMLLYSKTFEGLIFKRVHNIKKANLLIYGQPRMMFEPNIAADARKIIYGIPAVIRFALDVRYIKQLSNDQTMRHGSLPMALQDGYETTGMNFFMVIVHELAHVLGFYEHQTSLDSVYTNHSSTYKENKIFHNVKNEFPVVDLCEFSKLYKLKLSQMERIEPTSADYE